MIAFITSKGTLDKENSAVRKYLAQRADLIGAIRLPNNAFKANARTEVTSDIIFLQKRDRMTDIEPDWVHLDTDENGIRMNRYLCSTRKWCWAIWSWNPPGSAWTAPAVPTRTQTCPSCFPKLCRTSMRRSPIMR